jgi:hypothetical protein
MVASWRELSGAQHPALAFGGVLAMQAARLKNTTYILGAPTSRTLATGNNHRSQTKQRGRNCGWRSHGTEKLNKCSGELCAGNKIAVKSGS